ncbi:biogenesis of lysosome-related organelles complex 1 subunit 1 [Cynara cardunculus var. scolymus]|uniref:Biogenesis of lysosome-related organelles complex 1 subunit 1 n=1 Tax=Cynara cardunculus var. scolymus TaxID=59895 RepID=A0A103Y710_CYNCS|nr:biogenesis of lysosome-related organelles complex 1 subunit 1 [Cynara cardunculus var. scolymus]XP_024975090.1 biogenesis of lysosome-related organelles complex 1 subunit 1 [Cynara cardunculus var. scolymus]XP_024975091.1 biogenesis of lysosome-related organelles complex 1 subunit 1 [Cynara cardunculus var. scolymus]KVI03698.1 GCN5-like 1 [Cynara cardunculus var. scolymus]
MSSPRRPQARARVKSSPEMNQSDLQSGSLEASLLRLFNDHQNADIRLREHTEKSKKEAIKSASRVSDLLVEAVNGDVEECFVNEKRIEVEIRALKATILRFGKQTNQWLASTHAINNAIKEIGDFENWMKTMELDCKSITAAISNIHQS